MSNNKNETKDYGLTEPQLQEVEVKENLTDFSAFESDNDIEKFLLFRSKELPSTRYLN